MIRESRRKGPSLGLLWVNKVVDRVCMIPALAVP